MSAFNELHWTEKTAARLKKVQASFADAPAEERVSELRDELTAAMAELRVLDEAQRSACLAKLEQRFPVWGNVAVVETPAPRASPPASPSRGPQTAAELLNGLVTAAGAMSRDQLSLYAQKLKLAGFVEAHERSAPGRRPVLVGMSMPEEADRELLQRSVEALLQALLTERGGKTLDLPRCLEVLQFLIERSIELESVVWDFWQRLAKRHNLEGTFRREISIQRTLADFLTGSRDLTIEGVAEVLKETFDLVLVLAPALENAGKRFAIDFRQDFDPDGIRDAVALDTSPRTPVRDPEAPRYWKKYCDLTAHNTDSVLEERFQKLLVKAIIEAAGR